MEINIKSKYNIGDTVYFLKWFHIKSKLESKLFQVKISQIRPEWVEDEMRFRYFFENITYKGEEITLSAYYFEEYEIFSSVDEILNSLKENIIKNEN